MKKLCAAIAALCIPAATSAMPVSTFLTKADALEAKGVRALFASDYKLLKKTIQADSLALRDERLVAKAAGRTPAYCPSGPAKLDSNEIVQAMRAVPAAQRARTDTRDALRAYFVRRYPCGR
jgi:hypothetical protein